ncbi:MAG: hypothetical protein LKF34_04090 [Acidaminococcaceae bacterium]|jgi:uncharacterized coiled-coil protein SlyX|nr:hypothetical protein [Acidaminococcaceae bacterium]
MQKDILLEIQDTVGETQITQRKLRFLASDLYNEVFSSTHAGEAPAERNAHIAYDVDRHTEEVDMILDYTAKLEKQLDTVYKMLEELRKSKTA